MSAAASGPSRGDARGHGCRLSEFSVSGVPIYRSSHGRAVGARGFWIGSSDREVDHGEEVQSEEEIGQEKEGRSGQKEEDIEGVEEEDSEEGCQKAGQEGEEGRQQAEKAAAAPKPAPKPAPAPMPEPAPAPAWTPISPAPGGGDGT